MDKLLRKLTLAVDQGPASVVITDLEGHIEYVNHRFTQITGYTAEEARGRTPSLWKSGLTPEATYTELWRTITAGRQWRGEVQNRRKNGEVYWDLVTITPIRDESGAVTNYLGIQQDLTELRRATDAVAASEQRQRMLFETLDLIVLGLDADGRVDYVNPFFERLTGWTAAEARGADWIHTFLPEAVRPTIQTTFRELIAHDLHSHYTNAILTKAGAQRLISWNNTVVRDGQGRATGTLSIGEDVTERVNLERQLQQAQKMEAVGQLAGGVAHDFNNVLTAITGYAEFLRMDLPPSDPKLADVDEIQNAVKRAGALTRQLLAFSRQQVLQPVVLNPNDVVHGIEKMLRRLIGENFDLATALDPSAGQVKADPGQIEQVLLNLVVNARDAMPEGGRITIATVRAQIDEVAAAAQGKALAPGDYVVLSVSDNGVGMSSEVRLRIFEPFFTTKPSGKGSGLGLATVYGIVTQSGGHITVYSEPGFGSTFKVYLPFVAPASTHAAEAASIERPREGSETVLIAEDDEAVRALATEILQRYGYTVLAARNGEEALFLAERFEGLIQLVVTDVVMTGMDGPTLVERLRARHPALRVLFTSGYTGEAVQRRGVLASGAPFLEKPFTAAGLARKVRDALDAPLRVTL